MADVREITRRALICPRVAISSSVMPSAKYSCEASLDRLSSGSTATDSMADGADSGRGHRVMTTKTVDAIITVARAATAAHVQRGRLGEDVSVSPAGGGASGSACGEAAATGAEAAAV